MTTEELILRLAVIALGAMLAALGGILAYRGREATQSPVGCLSLALVVGGLLMVGTAAPW